MKLRLVRLYKDEEVPDHLLQEVLNLVEKMGKALSKELDGYDPNIVLSAFNRFHAALIVTLVTANGLKEAAQTEAIGLLKNVDHIAGTDHFDVKEDEK